MFLNFFLGKDRFVGEGQSELDFVPLILELVDIGVELGIEDYQVGVFLVEESVRQDTGPVPTLQIFDNILVTFIAVSDRRPDDNRSETTWVLVRTNLYAHSNVTGLILALEIVALVAVRAFFIAAALAAIRPPLRHALVFALI